MNKQLKYKFDERRKLYFSSDFHIHHNPNWPVPLWKLRGYDSAEHASQSIQDKINERVGPDDHLFFMGDLSLNSTDERTLEWLSGVKCQNIFKLFGNHHSYSHRLYKNAVKEQYGLADVEVYPLRLNNLVFLGNYQEIRVGSQLINMCHFPIHSWNQMGKGSWMLSGHQHNTDVTRNPDAPINKCLDVSWDYKKDLWSFDEIADVMSTRQFVPVDHHAN